MVRPYDPYRERLSHWSKEEVMLSALRQVGQTRGWWSPERRWKRSYGRFDISTAPLVTLVYETLDDPQRLCVLELFETKPDEETEGQAVLKDETGTWLRLSRFPHDPALPTLSKVLTEGARVVRYRPHKRCTLRLDSENAAMFIKVFPDDSAERLFRDGQALWQASVAGTLPFAVAHSEKWNEAARSVWQSAVPGQPILENLFGTEGPELAERMGRAAASLMASGLTPSLQFDRDKQLQKSLQNGCELGERAPWLKPAVDCLLETLTELHALAEERPLRPIHGAPHAHQWLENGRRLGLVDFDGFTFGDPELDVATFVTEMDFENWRRVRVERINDGFIRGYEAVAGGLEPRLLKAYRAHKRLSKAIKNLYSVRPDGDIRAERTLGRALVWVLDA